jgi:hypothetical protein
MVKELELLKIIVPGEFVAGGIIAKLPPSWRDFCRHPEDRIPPYISSKSRQGAGHAFTRCHTSCRCCHVSRGPGPRLLAELSSGAATCSSAPDLASLPRWAPALPRVPEIWALPPREESSGDATCSSALDLVSLSRWAPALPCDPDLASPRGELRCCHVPHGPQRAVDHGNKERHSCPRHAAGLTCVQSTVACYRGACKACGHAATIWT